MNATAFIEDLARSGAGMDELNIPPVPPVYVRTREQLRVIAASLSFDVPSESDVDAMISAGVCCGRPIIWVD